MPTFLVRLVSIALVSCLLVDPSLASALTSSSSWNSASIPTHIHEIPFNTEALTQRLLEQHFSFDIRDASRINRWAGAAAIGIAMAYFTFHSKTLLAASPFALAAFGVKPAMDADVEAQLPENEVTDFLKKLGNQIQIIRQQKNISIKKLSKGSHISRARVRDMLNGAHAARLSSLTKILDVLQVSFWELLSFLDEPVIPRGHPGMSPIDALFNFQKINNIPLKFWAKNAGISVRSIRKLRIRTNMQIDTFRRLLRSLETTIAELSEISTTKTETEKALLEAETFAKQNPVVAKRAPAMSATAAAAGGPFGGTFPKYAIDFRLAAATQASPTAKKIFPKAPMKEPVVAVAIPAESSMDEKVTALLQKNSAKYRSGMLRFLISKHFSVPIEDIENIVHDAFVRGLERAYQLRDARILSTWLNRIALNFMFQFMRARSRFQSVELDNADQPVQPINSVESRELRDAISRLPQVKERTLIARILEGHSTEEIASMLGISKGAVKARIHRARRALLIELTSKPKEIQLLRAT